VIDKKITVAFADEDIQRAYFKVKADNPSLYKFLERATDDINTVSGNSHLFRGGMKAN
jgi:hypothetical protein